MYKAGIIAAIGELKDRTGSSRPAIRAHIEANNKGKSWANGTFLKVLRDMVASGEIVQVKQSYKLSPEFKKSLAVSQVQSGRPAEAFELFVGTSRPALAISMYDISPYNPPSRFIFSIQRIYRRRPLPRRRLPPRRRR